MNLNPNRTSVQRPLIKKQKTPAPPSPTDQTLYKLNWAAFVLHLASCIAFHIMIYSYTWKVYSTETRVEWEDLHNGTMKITSKVETVAKIPLEYLVSGAHLTSALFHLAYIVDDARYIKRVDSDDGNYFRWCEYAISATLMQVVVQVLSGFTDVWTLSLCGVCMAVTQCFGYFAERYQKITYYFLGFPAFLVPWIGILTKLHQASNTPPWWVIVIVWGLFVIFALFTLPMAGYLGLCPCCTKVKHNHRKIELYYCILSLLAKLFLAWFLFAGAYSRKDIIAYKPT